MYIARFVPIVLLGVVLSAAGREQPAIQTVLRASSGNAAVSQYLVALPHIALGGDWQTKVVITNTSGTAADVSLYYFADSGAPLILTVDGAVADHTDLLVPAGGSREVAPQGSVGGWAALIYTNAGIKAQGIFLWHSPGDPPEKYTEAAAPVISQAGVSCIVPLPAASTYSMPYDETEGRFSGYGFANTSSTATTLTLTFYGPDGQVVGGYTEPLAGFAHDAFLLKDKVPAVAGSKGMVTIGGTGVVPLGFRFTPYYTFTTWLP